MGKCCEHEENEENIIIDILGIVVFIVAMIIKNKTICEILFYLSYILLGYNILISAVKKIFSKDIFDENFLMSIATLGAMLIHEHTEAIAVLVLYKIGEFLQDKATDNTKNKIKEAAKLKIDTANLIENGKVVVVSPKNLKVGDIILVKTGQKVPVDAVLLDDKASFDTSSLTGEIRPQENIAGDKILSSSVNISSAVKLKVDSKYEDSTVSKIIEMIEEATSKKSKVEKFITKFSKIYTPIVVLFAILIVILLPLIFNVEIKDAVYRALNFLVISCPCALVISVPLSFFVGIGISSKSHILVKGTNYLDILSNLNTIIFDKTGTITDGKFNVDKVVILNDKYEEEEFCSICANVEALSNHFIAKTISNYYEQKYNKGVDTTKITSHNEISGKGINAVIDGKNVSLGNYKLVEDIVSDNLEIQENGTIIFVVIDNELAGYIILKDNVKSGCKNIAQNLKKLGVKKVCMLTGDRESFANSINEEIKFDEVKSDLLPQDKALYIENLKKNGVGSVAFVGDGINDGVALSTSDVGISMANSSDLAIDSADIVLLNNNPNVICDAIKIAKYTTKIAKQNILFILIIKIVFLLLSALGMLNMWIAVFGDVGVTLICILNSLRIYRIKSYLKEENVEK